MLPHTRISRPKFTTRKKSSLTRGAALPPLTPASRCPAQFRLHPGVRGPSMAPCGAATAVAWEHPAGAGPGTPVTHHHSWWAH